MGVDSSALGREGHFQLVKKKLAQVIEEARREGVEFILLAGDTFDSNALPTSWVLEFLEILGSAPDLRFVLLPGGGGLHQEEISGHDAYTRDSLYRRPEIRAYLENKNHLFLLTPENPVLVFKEKGLAFYGGFFHYPRSPLVEGIPYHLAVMHGAFGERASLGEISLKTSQAQNYHYLALGHYHRFKKVSERAYYSGAFVQFEYPPFGEAQSGFLEVKLEEGTPRASFRTLEDAPRFLSCQIFTEEDLERLRSLDFTHTFVKIVAYLEDWEEALKDLLQGHPSQIRVGAEAKVKRETLFFKETLEKILQEKIPEEWRSEVEEILLFALGISTRRSEFEGFLKDKFRL